MDALTITIYHNNVIALIIHAYVWHEEEIDNIARMMCERRGGIVSVHTRDDREEYPLTLWEFSYIDSGGRLLRVSQDDMYEWDDRCEMSEDFFYGPPPSEPKDYMVRMKPYARTHSVRSYGESDHRHSNRKSSLNYMSFIKRQERRAARRMGKALIREQLHAHAA